MEEQEYYKCSNCGKSIEKRDYVKYVKKAIQNRAKRRKRNFKKNRSRRLSRHRI